MTFKRIVAVTEKRFPVLKSKGRSTGLAVFAVALVGLCALSGSGRSAVSRLISFIEPAAASSANHPIVTASEDSAAPSEPGQRLTGAELITIRPKGFEPSAITRASGPFILRVDNRSGLREVSLQLDRVAGSRLRAVQVPRQKLDWQDRIDLTPGTLPVNRSQQSSLGLSGHDYPEVTIAGW
jgi:hypothetical protein